MSGASFSEPFRTATGIIAIMVRAEFFMIISIRSSP